VRNEVKHEHQPHKLRQDLVSLGTAHCSKICDEDIAQYNLEQTRWFLPINSHFAADLAGMFA
jgi:hypothetical protein